MNIIIIGGGQVGAYVAKIMLEAGNKVRIIDHRQKVIDIISKSFAEDIILQGDGADLKILEKAGIHEADVVASVTGSDEINLVTSTIAKFEFGVERVIARVNNPKNDWLFTGEMGVDVKISQADLLANVIADQIDMENIVTLMRLNHGDNSIVEFTINRGSQADEKSLKELDIPNDVVLIAIQRGQENLVARGDTVLKAGDHVLAYIKTSEEKKLYQLMH